MIILERSAGIILPTLIDRHSAIETLGNYRKEEGRPRSRRIEVGRKEAGSRIHRERERERERENAIPRGNAVIENEDDTGTEMQSRAKSSQGMR
jgi:hypothetical protein